MKNPYYEYNVKTSEIPLKSDKRNDVIEWIYATHIVEWYTTYLLKKTLADETIADEVQELYLMICEIPDAKWVELYAQGQYAVSAYVTGLIHQQLISTNSKIYKKYTKYEVTQKVQSDLFWQTYDEEHEDY